MIGFDFADPESGISASLRPSGAAVVFDHDDVLGSSAEAFTGSETSEQETAVRLELDGATLEVELVEVGPQIIVGGDGAGSEELSVCQVLGELETGGATKPVNCLGTRITAATEPGESSVTRSIAVAFGDGGLLALRAARPPGAETHAEETLSAALAEPDAEPSGFEEVLLSTQYDGEGRQVRATVELWPAQDGPGRRAAGTIVCGTSLTLGERRLDLAFFRWSMDGKPGLGRYEVVTSTA